MFDSSVCTNEFESGAANIIDTNHDHFTRDIGNELEMKILKLEPHQPPRSFPKDPLTNRSFSSDYYQIKQKQDNSFIGVDFAT